MATVGIKRGIKNVTEDSDSEDATNYFCPNLWMDLSVVLELNRKMKRQRSQKSSGEESVSNISSSPISLLASDTIQDTTTHSPPSVVCPSLYQIQQAKDITRKPNLMNKLKHSLQQRRRRTLPSTSKATPSTWRRGSGFSTVSDTGSEKHAFHTPVVKERSAVPSDHSSPNVDIQLVEASPKFCSPTSQAKDGTAKQTPPISKSHDEKEEEGNSSPNTKNDSLIQQFSMYDGTVIATYTSVGNAAKAVDASPSAIYLCLSGKRKYAKGFYWKRSYVAATNPYIVQQISTHDDRIVATYASVPEAAQAVCCTKATIYNCLSGKRNTAVGYRWKKLYPINEESSSSTTIDVVNDDSDSSSTTTADASSSGETTPITDIVLPVVTPR